MANLPDELRLALESAVSGVPVHELTLAAGRLTTTYREGGTPASPILRSERDVAAYAAYRMPATYFAVRAALAATAESLPGFRPATHLDLGAGTGAALWAAAAVWPSLARVTAVEQSPHAVALGRRLAAKSAPLPVREARWQTSVIEPAALPDADLVTVSYLLGELPAAQSAALVAALARTAGKSAIVLIEPGTPAGYRRIVDARDQLIGGGLTVVAPCPHGEACPIPRDRDWCHFSVRVNRSSVHRTVKHGELAYEDEKFSYIAAVGPQAGRGSPAPGRVLRHPQQRKGLVSLRLCTPAGLQTVIVSKRQGDLYRAAKDTEWGDPWPPGESPSTSTA